MGSNNEEETDLSIDIPSISSSKSNDTYVICTPSSQSIESQQSLDEDPENDIEKLATVLNTLNGHIQEFCESSLTLQYKRDFLLLSINIIKQNDLLKETSKTDQEDIECYTQSINTRLRSVDIRIGRTHKSDSIQRIDELITSIICFRDILLTHKHCEQYLKICEDLMTKDENDRYSKSFADDGSLKKNSKKKTKQIDTEFYALVLGCKQKDRENIRKRLLALMDHVNYQICSNVE